MQEFPTYAEAFAEVAVKQSARSLCRLTAVQLTSANASYTIDLDGRDAENMLGGVFLAGEITVKKALQGIYRKLGVDTRLELVMALNADS